MEFHIDIWIREYTGQVKKLFGNRIWFVGLQGSYGRGEATSQSDIDTVVILDRVMPEDINAYSKLLDRLPNREKACGFISGKEELQNWERSDLFQFCFDTVPIIGTLEELKEGFSDEDVLRAVRIGACNVYHGCAHNMIHEKDWKLLKELYKSAVFTLQAVGYLKTGRYETDKTALLKHLALEDQTILHTGRRLKNCEKVGKDDDFAQLSEQLLSWASRWIIACGVQRKSMGSTRKA